ncbi:MAG: reverse transcriptase domain-containing protein, partial [SAR324 cluster bacterium]|nr:reverse transcriptase domain-containing protein [SAR324 cluster bacterium]
MAAAPEPGTGAGTGVTGGGVPPGLGAGPSNRPVSPSGPSAMAARKDCPTPAGAAVPLKPAESGYLPDPDEVESFVRGLSARGHFGSGKKPPKKTGTHEGDLATEMERMESLLMDCLNDCFPDTPSLISPCRDKIMHVPKHEQMRANIFGMVARSVGRNEMRTHPRAIKAMNEEWDRLRKAGPEKKGAWREDLVESWHAVKARFNAMNQAVHVGDLLEVCVQKHSELPDTPENSEKRKYKGRVVYGGHRVRDQTGQAALFQELHSCPATSTASRVCDVYGLFQGNDEQQADAVMAYNQAYFKGTPTFVRLPKHRQPAHFEGIIDPVCPMELALYGHPESGYYWEEHCDECLRKEGFVPVEEWPGCYWHEDLKAFLIVYVDDFKVSAPEGNLKKVWARIQKHIEVDDIGPPGNFLGCNHRRFIIDDPKLPKGNQKIRVMEWDMQDQINQTIELYRELLDDPEKPLRKCSTPFRSAKVKGGIAKPVTTGPWLKCPWCKGCFDE